jgi:hypothetical protein
MKDLKMSEMEKQSANFSHNVLQLNEVADYT